MPGQIEFRESKTIPLEAVLELYRSNGWSAADKPDALYQGLLNSHALISAWDGDQLVGLANSISDGFLVVYYPHALVLSEYQGTGIGREMLSRLMERYNGFHQHALIADGNAVGFYERCGFERAGSTVPMWIYQGDEH